MAASMAWSCRVRGRTGSLLLCRKLFDCLSSHAGCATVVPISKGSATGQQNIVIPRRKKRNSVSILEALATTVTRDPNAPDYRYHDDPFLIPTNGSEKRVFTLAKASGQKAARFAINSWPHLFINDPSEPKVKAFQPPKIPYTCNDVCEEALLERISKARTADAIDMYEKLKAGGKEVSVNARKQLLELTCIYNGQDPPEPITRDENWFRESFMKETSRHANTWKEDNYAEKLFEELTEKDTDIYASMVLGTAKYYNAAKAWSLYEDMMAKAMPVRTEVFNGLLDIAYYLKDSHDSRYELAMVILKTMDENKVAPNLETFNAVLRLLSRINRYRPARRLAMETLNEMKACKIEPSLSTWNYILQVFYPKMSKDATDRGVTLQDVKMLHEVLGFIEGKQFCYHHEDDLRFFAGAMIVAASLRDIDAAYKIDALLNTGRNSSLIGDAVLSNNYYSFFFKLVTEVEPLDKVMAFYRKLVPNMWIPSYGGFDALLSTVELYEGYQYIPEVWASIVSLDYSSKIDISGRLMKLMASKRNNVSVQKELVLLTDRIRDHVLEAEELKRNMKLVLTGQLYGHLIMTCLNGDDFDRAWAFFSKLQRGASMLTDSPSEESLLALTQACIAKNGDTAKALECTKVAKDMGLSTKVLLAELQAFAAKTKNDTLQQELTSYL